MTEGPIVLIIHQYAYYGKCSTIHSIGLLSHFVLDIDDQSSVIPGHKQCMVSPDWWIIPLNIIKGLTRIPMCSPMDDNLKTLPHVIITSDVIWDPIVLGHSIDPFNDTYHPGMAHHIDEEEFTS